MILIARGETLIWLSKMANSGEINVVKPKAITSPRHAMKNKPSSALNRLFNRGHKKVHYKKANGELMMLFSENEHKRIAQLIAQWIAHDDNSDPR
jgi:hypothetical protein